MTSVVSSRPATDAAFCSARRVTQRLREGALFQHVVVLAGARVVAVGALARLDGVQDNRGINARVLDDLTQRQISYARMRIPTVCLGSHHRRAYHHSGAKGYAICGAAES